MTTTPETTAISQLHITGNMIPLSWYQAIRMPNGKQGTKPDIYAINLLADIVYWYRHREVRDEDTGRVIGYSKKFRGDYLQRSHKQIAEFFGLSVDVSKDIVRRLVVLGLIEVIIKKRVDLPDGRMLFNVMYMKPIVEMIRKVTHGDNHTKSGSSGVGPDAAPTLSGNSATHLSGNSTPTYTETSCTETSYSNSKESNASRVTSTNADDDKKQKSPHKGKKESTRRLYQNQVDASEFPYVSEMLRKLNETIVDHESKGLVHRFALDKRHHELTVNPDHLDTIEENLSELGCYAPDGKEYGYVFSKLIRLYNIRIAKSTSKTAKVNLAFLAGVNMFLNDEPMGGGEYVKWVNDFVLGED